MNSAEYSRSAASAVVRCATDASALRAWPSSLPSLRSPRAISSSSADGGAFRNCASSR
jgi:hypothetical protein